MMQYHDTEWGVPEYDRRAVFERLVLESMQAGLSWSTVLMKRSNMRQAFLDFDPDALARVRSIDDTHWLQDAGLIRHRGKLEAMVNNARCFCALQDPALTRLWSLRRNRRSRSARP